MGALEAGAGAALPPAAAIPAKRRADADAARENFIVDDWEEEVWKASVLNERVNERGEEVKRRRVCLDESGRRGVGRPLLIDGGCGRPDRRTDAPRLHCRWSLTIHRVQSMFISWFSHSETQQIAQRQRSDWPIGRGTSQLFAVLMSVCQVITQVCGMRGSIGHRLFLVSG